MTIQLADRRNRQLALSSTASAPSQAALSVAAPRGLGVGLDRSSPPFGKEDAGLFDPCGAVVRATRLLTRVEGGSASAFTAAPCTAVAEDDGERGALPRTARPLLLLLLLLEVVAVVGVVRIVVVVVVLENEIYLTLPLDL